MSTLYKDNYTLQKPKSYNKNCWSLIYNMNYGLKSRLHKSQIYNKKRKIHSGLAVPSLRLQSSPMSDPFLSQWWTVKARQGRAGFSCGGEGESVAGGAALPHIISRRRISVIIFVRVQSIVNGFNYIPLACQLAPGRQAGDVLTGERAHHVDQVRDAFPLLL